jgi:hypothetical protein
MPEIPAGDPDITYDNHTFDRVISALAEIGISSDRANHMILHLMRHGIVFREHAGFKRDPEHYRPYSKP